MIYGDAKVRNMARSILPSRARKRARETAAMVKRHNRRLTHHKLCEWAKHDDPYDYEGHVYDYNDSPAVASDTAYTWAYDQGIKGVVSERRDADNVNAFLSWAKAKAAHLDDPEDRYNYIKSLMPDNLPGRHALSHLIFLSEFDFRDHHGYRSYGNRAKDPFRDIEYVKTLLKIILEEGFHAKYNKSTFWKFPGIHALDMYALECTRHLDYGEGADLKAFAEKHGIHP